MYTQLLRELTQVPSLSSLLLGPARQQLDLTIPSGLRWGKKAEVLPPNSVWRLCPWFI